MTNRPLDDWHGVSTDRLGRVTGLNLSSINLSPNPPKEGVGLAS